MGSASFHYRFFFRSLLLLSLLITTLPDDGFAATKSRSLCRRLILSAVAVAALTYVPTVFHNTAGKLSGHEHIGRGIYFDMEAILGKFSPIERSLLTSDATPAIEKVGLLNQRLRGDYGNWIFIPFAPASDASHYFDPSNSDRGVCRHKACILDATLRHLNIRSEIQSGTRLNKPYAWHVWVYLPDEGMVADPTEGTLTAAEEFWKGYEISLPGVPLPTGWY